ncbi:MAG TPA: 50S ribosomal protein L11 methyltransferase [Candidatus Kapabacteria bacterium]|nr:50S ribosomal protein L11 methyltransferase [Candidatus Kapabacteria bacterium]
MLKTNYINLHIYLPDEYQELAYSYIYEYEFTGIEEKFDEIIITFDASKFNEQLKQEIIDNVKQAFTTAYIIKEEKFEDKNWNEEWEKNVPLIIVNDRIAIAPSWKIDELAQELKIVINPKMSFGTGDHPTTRLCCRLLETVLKENEDWIDVGTGTGVLAILAKKLGASNVIAFDNNIWSIENAEENFILNNVEDEITLLETDIDTYDLPKCDGIVANIFLHLAKLGMPKFYHALKESKGHLLLSGILSYDKDIIIENAEENGFQLVQTLIEDEWIAFDFVPKEN